MGAFLQILSAAVRGQGKGLDSVSSGRGWFPWIGESLSGAWQRNVEIKASEVSSHHAVFACQTLISGDIAKLRVKLVAEDAEGIWQETKNPAWSPVLRKPNAFQTRQQFYENWVLSKLGHGNTYVLKGRDNRGVVTKLYVLDPTRVRPLVESETGAVYYELLTDHLSEVGDRVVVPAREIIHDRFNCLFHPLVGLSPIYACGLAATQGLAIQNNSTLLFQNGARPSGILTAPGDISKETADELKTYWEQNFAGKNAAKIAVLGDGLQYASMTMKAVDAQVIDQLKWTAEVVCSTFHVPPYKIGAGATPAYNNIQALNLEYYSQCLQALIEAIELCLDEGLGIGEGVNVGGTTYGTEFDTDNLLRMDAATQMDVIEKSKNVLTLDERRKKLGAGKIEGGDTVYMQEQDHSIQAISARDAQIIETAKNPPQPPPPPTPPPANADEPPPEDADKALAAAIEKQWEARLAA